MDTNNFSNNNNLSDSNSDKEDIRILKNIEQLQTMERSLYKELEEATITTNKDSIVNKINQLSEVRMSLYKSLSNASKSLQKVVDASRTELVDLLTLVSIVEDELNNAKLQLNQLYKIKTNKMRMVEINTYYGKRYRAQASLMKLIIFIFVILLILAILHKKSLLPDELTKILLGIVLAVGGFFIIRRILDISWRDNMNFDAYDWKFDPDAQKKSDETGQRLMETPVDNKYKDAAASFNGIDCIGDACCTEGMKYDILTRKCIKAIAPNTFAVGQLTKGCFTTSS